MNKKRTIIFGFLLFINDLIFLSLSFYLAFIFKFKIDNKEFLGSNIRYYIIYSVIGVLIIIILFYFRKLYNYQNLYRGMGENEGIIISVIITVFLLIIFNYYFNRDTYQLSRIWIIYIVLLSIFFSIITRLIAKKLIFKIFSRINMVTNLLVVGINEESKRIAKTLSNNKIEKINFFGFIDDLKSSKYEDNNEFLKYLNLDEYKILGDINDIGNLIENYHINRIIISSKNMAYFDILDLLDKVKDMSIEVQISPSLFEFSVSRMKMFESMGIPLIQIQKSGIKGIDYFYKLLIDYTFGVILFTTFIILFPFIALLIKLDSKGPVLYVQERYGKDFKKIKIYKFRTMRVGADKEKEILKNLYSRKEGFKIKDDPRITRVGKFLRKTSIDELPQAINVIKGDISIVGPRALAIKEGDLLEEWEKKRMQVKQGITGLWQVSGRSDISYEERMKLDLYYIHNWSIQLELRIILLTILKLFVDRSAY